MRSYSSWVIVAFMILMMGAWFAPPEWAGTLVLGSMAAILVYVAVSNLVPYIRSSGKPFIFINMRTGVSESAPIFKRVRTTPSGLAVRRCEKEVEDALGKNSRVGALCIELEDEPFLYTQGPDKVVTVFPENTEIEELFDYTSLETDFGLSVPVRLANMRGVLLGAIHETVEDTGFLCRYLRRFRGTKCVREVEHPIVGITWTRVDDVREMNKGINAVKERFAGEKAEVSGKWVDRLGRLHYVDTEKEVLMARIEMLKNYISNMKKAMLGNPLIMLGRVQIGEEGETEADRYKWLAIGLAGGIGVMLTLAFLGVI